MHRLRIIYLISLPLLLVVSTTPARPVIAQGELSLELYAYPSDVYTTETAEITATLTGSEDIPVEDKEIIFATSLGTIEPEKAVTDADGKATVTFTAPDESGTSHVSAEVEGISETIEIKITSTFQWIIYMLECLLGIFGVGGATALYLRRARRARAVEPSL